MTIALFGEDDGELEKYQQDLEVSNDAKVQRVTTKITDEAEGLVDELLFIIYNREVNDDGDYRVDAKTKLSAIGMLLDRSIPKKGVDSTKSAVVEESGTRKRIREEIEAMMKEQEG